MLRNDLEHARSHPVAVVLKCPVVVVVVNLYFLQLHEDFTTKDERKN